VIHHLYSSITAVLCPQLASVQFHLINTTILFLSREGLRRGCLRAQQVQDASGATTILGIAALCIPLGAITTLCTCALALRGSPSLSEPYAVAVLLQGILRCNTPCSAEL
jgi:oligosaccharide translocation protein RFT1